MIRYFSLVLICWVAVSQEVNADSVKAKQIYLSDQILRGAISDISKMDANELRALVRYFSECSGEITARSCRAAHEAYEMEFGEFSPKERPIDAWMTARSTVEQDKSVHPASAVDVPAIVNEVSRELILERAIRERFRALSGTKVR